MIDHIPALVPISRSTDHPWDTYSRYQLLKAGIYCVEQTIPDIRSVGPERGASVFHFFDSPPFLLLRSAPSFHLFSSTFGLRSRYLFAEVCISFMHNLLYPPNYLPT